MEEILIIGGGGHAKSVIDVIEQQKKYKIVGIIDTSENLGKEILGHKVIGTDENLPEFKTKVKNATIAIGQIKTNELRVSIFKRLKKLGFNLPVIISPFAYVSKYSKIDEGTVIFHHAVVNAGSTIGKNCIINTKALIEHDAIIQDHCHISTGGIVNGGAIVKSNTFFGSNAVSRENIEIEGFIKAGSLAK
ncbi:NeuD/PglB/VioB family sugar acetyltransferase [Candidatus Kapabacteria bacterium]|nr:NeuD/PglB/VioB family sugar acetyltransferase [Candidatus Kapabacteria bacterium]